MAGIETGSGGIIHALVVFLLVCCLSAQAVSGDDDFNKLRQAMIEEIEADVRATAIYIDKKSLNEKVMQVMGRVPRHEFVPERKRSHAYENRPLAIGYGQTISQPYIVALMTDLLHPAADHRVLEIGTGSGYQAAILAKLTGQVYSIEIIEELAGRASETFQRLGYTNIESKLADGYYGWESAAPFDAIIVTAAAGHVPPPLVKQLKPGGRMVIPIGGRFQVQQLMLIKKADDEIRVRQILPVRFVPLTGGH